MGELSNEQLVLRIKAGENVADNMLQLWQQNQGFIKSIAKKYTAYAEMEDLVQQSYFGLCHAVNNYNQDSGTTFCGYAYFWIRQSIHSYIEDCGKVVRLPRHFRVKLMKYKRITASMCAELNRKPTDQELSYYLGINSKKLEDLKQAAVFDKMGSLDISVGEDGDNTLCDFVESPNSPENDILDKIQAEQLKTVIWGLVDGLPGMCPETIRARYQDLLSFKEVAEKLGITIEAVRQWQAKGLRELRKPARSNELMPFIRDDYVYNQALHGNGVESFNRTWTSSTERVALKL